MTQNEARNSKLLESRKFHTPRTTGPTHLSLETGAFPRLGVRRSEFFWIMTPLHCYLLLSALLFAIGLAGALTRRNAIIVLIGIELMLNAANLNFIAFWRYASNPEALTGIIFVLFSIGVAAAEAAVGLALVISIYRHYKTANVDQIDSMKG
jgi:NADH:ubiquinone oxidoreductase subunit K